MADTRNTINFLKHKYGLEPVTRKGYITGDFFTLISLLRKANKDRHPITGEILDYE